MTEKRQPAVYCDAVNDYPVIEVDATKHGHYMLGTGHLTYCRGRVKA